MKLRSSLLYQPFYLRLCRFYARHFVKDKPADSTYAFLCSFQFWRTHRFWPNFLKPLRFTEKLWSRMLYDRDPLLRVLNDKLQVRGYVEEKVGNNCLIPLLWHGEDPEKIPFTQLPSKYVIKATHGAGYTIFVKDQKKINYKTIKERIKKIIEKNYCLDRGIGIEWGYKKIKPQIIIEPFIDDRGTYPVDYKFYCFSGRVEFLTVHFDRFTEHKTKTFDREFKPHEFRYQHPQLEGQIQRPSNFKEMVCLAEALAKGLNFIRVDLYSVNEKVYFSEFTPYPGGTTTKFLPARQDIILGRKWSKSVVPIRE